MQLRRNPRRFAGGPPALPAAAASLQDRGSKKRWRRTCRRPPRPIPPSTRTAPTPPVARTPHASAPTCRSPVASRRRAGWLAARSSHQRRHAALTSGSPEPAPTWLSPNHWHPTSGFCTVSCRHLRSGEGQDERNRISALARGSGQKRALAATVAVRRDNALECRPPARRCPGAGRGFQQTVHVRPLTALRRPRSE